MNINLIWKYKMSKPHEYFIVYNGVKAGIYTDWITAEDAAWFSTVAVDIYKTRQSALTAFKRFQRKNNKTTA